MRRKRAADKDQRAKKPNEMNDLELIHSTISSPSYPTITFSGTSLQSVR